MKDGEGEPIWPSTDDFTNGLVRTPKPFPYTLVPRQPNVHLVITAEAERADAELAAWQ